MAIATRKFCIKRWGREVQDLPKGHTYARTASGDENCPRGRNLVSRFHLSSWSLKEKELTNPRKP